MKKLIFGSLICLMAISTTDAKELYTTFTVHAEKSANLAFVSGGIVDKVTVDVSSKVQEGEILATLENSDLKAQLSLAETTLKYAKLDYDRQVKVKKMIDAAMFDKYAFKYEQAKVQVAFQQSQLDKTIMNAPFDGVIFEKSVEVGDAVSGAMIRTILKIQSLSQRKLILSFDQKYWKEVKVGQLFRYSVDGDETVYEGKIGKIYAVADSGNRKLRAEVEAKDFVVGLFGEGHIITTDTNSSSSDKPVTVAK